MWGLQGDSLALFQRKGILKILTIGDPSPC